MQNKNNLQFDCQECGDAVQFSVFDLDNAFCCSKCQKKYVFSEESLKRQLKKFEALCRQLIDSEEILAHTAVGVDIGEHCIKIPYRILLTRLNSKLDLLIGQKPLSITFRVEPLKDLQSLTASNKAS